MVKWNLNDLLEGSSIEDLERDVKKRVKRFKGYRKRLNNNLSVKEFFKILKELERIHVSLGKLMNYSHLKWAENTADPKSNALLTKMSQIGSDVGNDIMFFSLWFKRLSNDKASKYIKNSGKYRYFLESIRKEKKYTLGEKEEKIINLKDMSGEEVMTNLYDIITNGFMFKFKGKNMTLEEINSYKHSSNREDRKKSYDVVLERYKENENVLGELYKGIVLDWKNENLKIRKHKNPIEVRNFANDVSDKSVEALLSVIKRNRGVFQEYFRIKKKLCGLRSMDRYDIYAPYEKNKKNYDFEYCKNKILSVYKGFSEKFYENAKKIFEEGHIDSDITKNKKGGAFCATPTKDTTPYILLNHNKKMTNMFAMAHELGHGVHGIMGKDQTEFTYHATLPLAETASIFGEMILLKDLLKKSKKKDKTSILMYHLDNQYAAIMRQGYFVMFEKWCHDNIGSGVSIEDINKAYLDNLKEQFGKMNVPEVFKHEWKYVPHIYHTPFYCYAYAFGNLLVLSLYRMYEKEGEDFVPKLHKILSYGGSESPEKVLKEVGIDINKEEFWEEGFRVIKDEIEELKNGQY